jgi:hypothetical protein
MNNNLIEISKTTGDCAQYTGMVTIATYYGDRLIHKETQHNEGLKTLFDFMGSCLQGNWYEAKSKRPCKLVMLRAAEEEADRLSATRTGEAPMGGWSIPSDVTNLDRQEQHYWSSKYAVCNPVMYDVAAVAESTKESSSVTYHFRVPFLSLVGGSIIQKLMLLPSVATDYPTEACAFYILESPIEVPKQSANFTIIIDWTLKFTNSKKG